MLDYLFQFLLFLAKVFVILGGFIVLLAFIAKFKHKAEIEQGNLEDPEKATLVITDYAELLERDRLKVFNEVTTEEQRKVINKAMKVAGKKEKKLRVAQAKKQKTAALRQINEHFEASAKEIAVATAPVESATSDSKVTLVTTSVAQDATQTQPTTNLNQPTNSETIQDVEHEKEVTTHEESQNQTQTQSRDDVARDLDKTQAPEITQDKSAEEPNKDQATGVQTSFSVHGLFIIDFDGSVSGKEVAFLRRAVTLLVQVAEANDEVLLRLKSPGGVVNGYGLCAAELERLRKAGLNLTISVDEVAASGGYMMACVASKIIAAPFAYIGSIGVVAEFPNFNRVLKKYDVDYEQVTAGEFKRTMTTFGENTEEARAKFKEELKCVHHSFMAHVSKYRPTIDIDKVATGEHWLAVDALKLGLVDEIMTSDEYILNCIKKYDRVFKLEYRLGNKKNRWSTLVSSKLKAVASALVERFIGVKF